MTSTSAIRSGSSQSSHHNPALQQPPPPGVTNGYHHPGAAIDPRSLSPGLSPVNSDSFSPSGHHLETPAGSASTHSHYQPSDISELDEDPFFGATFDDSEGVPPEFLGESSVWSQPEFLAGVTGNINISQSGLLSSNAADDNSYPLTPERTASLYTASPRSEQRATLAQPTNQLLPTSISPQELQKPFKQEHTLESSQFTPSQSSSCRTSEDGLVPAPTSMNSPRPQVTVSVWDKDGNAPVTISKHDFGDASDDSPSAGASHEQSAVSVHRDSTGQWRPVLAAGPAGLGPSSRPSGEIRSANEMETQRSVNTRNDEVDHWLEGNREVLSPPADSSTEEIKTLERGGQVDNSDIPLGDATENQYKDGRAYIEPKSGQPNDTDYGMIAAHSFADPVSFRHIRRDPPGQNQPQTSQAAIARFEAMCRDTDSIVSRQATWGTRRRSLASIDVEAEVTSGNLFKKLSLSRSGDKGTKSGGLLRNISGFIRRPSIGKRTRTGEDEGSPVPDEGSQSRRDSPSHLTSPTRTSSGKRKSVSTLDTASALVSMGHNVASIGSGHTRSGSVSTGVSVSALRSPLGSLSAKMRRQRSKSEIPPPTSGTVSKSSSHSNLVDMLRKSGGPPAPLARVSMDMDDDDDDDDDLQDDADMRVDANVIDGVTPNFGGFQQHVLDLNPYLYGRHDFLVDRIAHQQVVRYKQLLSAKVTHLRVGANCACGSLCMAQGGTAIVQNVKNDARGKDPVSAQFDEDDDDDTAPVEGAIHPDSFPADIPMPPTQQLPAEFECQLCYARKKVTKPSDWTKHVHEDVQPFTCTWDRCKDPKPFKRKADWVRHENEGHRHLEWWTCDVDDCQHICYRRDNFLQHLVREHRYPEPKVKTKAALKKAGAVDPTWHKVEVCHAETTQRPQEEPCRFCGKEFPTWKKLTVHLAKHMEQVSLPVLRLVATKAKELDADTIISPVQDPPPRQFFPPAADENLQNAPMYPGAGGMGHMGGSLGQYQRPESLGYPMMAQGVQLEAPYYAAQPYGSIGGSLQQPHVGSGPIGAAYTPEQQVHGLPPSDDSYAQHSNSFMAMPAQGYSQMNALGLQNVPTDRMSSHLAHPMSSHMAYEGMMTPSGGHASPFSGQGTASPYSHSPRPNVGGQNQGWGGERRHSGYQ